MEKVKWKIEYLEWLKTAKNEEVLDEYVYCSIGDEYDGMRTDKCEWKLIKVEIELKERLVKCGFLPD